MQCFLNTLDNRKNNLRICTQSENLRNKEKHGDNKCGYKGVHWDTVRNKWKAQITLNQKVIYLGLYKNIADAAKMYNQAALKYHREFARLNHVV